MGKLSSHIISLVLFACLAGFAYLWPAEEANDKLYPRPRDPWVFVGSLDDRPRVLFAALHHDLWIAYDTEHGDVYKAWKGVLQPATNNDRAFSPWPASVNGLTYFARKDENPWRLIKNGLTSIPEVIYRGYRITGERLTLSYELVSEYGHRITVEESPEVIHTPNERPGLQREFFLDNVPDGFQVALLTELTTLGSRDDVQTDGLLQRIGGKTRSFVWGKTHDLSGRLIMTPGAATTLKTYFSPNILKNMEDNAELDPLELFRDNQVYRSMELGDESSASARLIRRQDHVPGVAVKVYGIGESIDSLMQLAPGQLPTSHAVEPVLDLTSRAHFGDLDFYFITHVSGFLNIVSEGTYSFQVLADDGVRFSVAGQVYYEHNGLQAARPSEDINIDFEPGVYPFRLEHFQSTGRKRLTLNWKPPWKTEFEVLRAPAVSARKEDQRRFSAGRKHVLRQLPDALIDLEQVPVRGRHPALSIQDLNIVGLKGSIGGLDFLSDGRLVVAAWDGSGTVYLVEGLDRPQQGLFARPIAKGLMNPFGLEVIDDEIFVLQKHELTHLIDADGDGLIDEYRVVANDWPLTNDFEELAQGLIYREGRFYAGLAVPVDADGAILIEDLPERGLLVRMGFDGSVEKIASGLQMVNGIESDKSGTLAVMDHRNPWFSDSRLLFAGVPAVNKLSAGAFLPAQASRANPLQMSSIWLPSSSQSDAPTQPIQMPHGKYQGQWLYGDLNGNRVNRVFVEEINDQVQGAVFRFSDGFAFPVNRMAVGPGAEIVAGGMAFDSQWNVLSDIEIQLQKMVLQDGSVFEIMAVRLTATGFELEFSSPIGSENASQLSNYRVYHWSNDEMKRQRRKDRSLVSAAEVENVEISSDGLRVRVEIASLKAGNIYYFNLDPSLKSEEGELLWSNEAWYSLNELPEVVVGMNN